MLENKKIEYIPAKPPKREQRVGIYARVSTNSAEQLKSISAQVSHLTGVIAANKKWLLNINTIFCGMNMFRQTYRVEDGTMKGFS